jgi:ABC-2 type transport system ATP-binding protein
MTAAIQIKNLSKHYGSLPALTAIDFQIPQGCFFGLLGPNGAGKSTLINIIAGLTHTSSGQVTVMGYDVRQQWRQARQLLGIVPQELVYDPFFTVVELLRLQSGYFGFGRENWPWIDELLMTLNLADKADENLGRLSGGMKRRVLIAQALVHKPQVMILDEPTAGVDVELRQILWQFVRKLHQQGHTIILTTHYLEEAEALCEHIAILKQGRLRAIDSKAALLQRQPYRLLCLKLRTEGSVTQLPPALADKVGELHNKQLILRLNRQDSLYAVLNQLHQAGIEVLDLHTRDPSLEDVFVELTH